MAYVILELLWNLWFAGAIISILHMVSTFCFGKPGWRWKSFFATVWFSLIWPLAILSPEGRKHLLGRINEL